MDTKHVVVAYDFSEAADVGLERAVELACREPHHVLHVIAAIDPDRGFGLDPGEVVDCRYAEQIQGFLLEGLAGVFEDRAPKGMIQFFVHARIGDPAGEILDLADEIGADLLILGAAGNGPTTRAVIAGARCPVIVQRPKEYAHVQPHPLRATPVAPRRYAYSSEAAGAGPEHATLH